ncbi:unnamed protein product [Calicophoron daubneyi]|uniref:Uncharacterized protein n=1 Tax=Calicophoron daubneyi TaxID=300641 RepID=A0AAV2T853_CALDB
MSRGRGLSRHALYRLRVKRTRETAARIQYFRERLLDIQRRRSSDPEIVTTANASKQPSVQSVEDSPTLHSTIISPVSGPSSAPSVTYPVMRATSFRGAVAALSITEKAATSQPILQHNTGCESVLQAIQLLDKKMTNFSNDIISRIENLDLHVAALYARVNKYHCDTLHNAGN